MITQSIVTGHLSNIEEKDASAITNPPGYPFAKPWSGTTQWEFDGFTAAGSDAFRAFLEENGGPEGLLSSNKIHNVNADSGKKVLVSANTRMSVTTNDGYWVFDRESSPHDADQHCEVELVDVPTAMDGTTTTNSVNRGLVQGLRYGFRLVLSVLPNANLWYNTIDFSNVFQLGVPWGPTSGNPFLHLQLASGEWRVLDRRNNASSSAVRATEPFAPTQSITFDVEYVPAETNAGYLRVWADGISIHEFFGQTIPTGTVSTGAGDAPYGGTPRFGHYASFTGLPGHPRPESRVVAMGFSLDTLSAVTSGDGSDWNTIQTAINSASPGDTIVIKDGDYLLSGSNKLTVNVANLTLVSESRLGVKLYRTTGSTGEIVDVAANGVTLDDLMIWGPESATPDPDGYQNPRLSGTANLPDSGEELYACVEVNGDDCSILRCDIRYARKPGLGYGVVISETYGDLLVDSCYFHGHRHHFATDGNKLKNVGPITFSNNICENSTGDGVDSHSGCQAYTVTGNTIRMGSLLTDENQAGIICQSTEGFTITDNVIEGGNGAFEMQGGVTVQYVAGNSETTISGTISGNTISDCRFGLFLTTSGGAPTSANITIGEGNTVTGDSDWKIRWDENNPTSTSDYTEDVSPITAGTLTYPPTVFT